MQDQTSRKKVSNYDKIKKIRRRETQWFRAREECWWALVKGKSPMTNADESKITWFNSMLLIFYFFFYIAFLRIDNLLSLRKLVFLILASSSSHSTAHVANYSNLFFFCFFFKCSFKSWVKKVSNETGTPGYMVCLTNCNLVYVGFVPLCICVMCIWLLFCFHCVVRYNMHKKYIFINAK